MCIDSIEAGYQDWLARDGRQQIQPGQEATKVSISSPRALIQHFVVIDMKKRKVFDIKNG